MADPKEEFEPLFDYTRIQPLDFASIDDDNSPDESPIFIPKRRKIADGEDDDEQDWLPPPPIQVDNSSKILEEDPTLKALRLKRQELASFAESADELLRAVEESVRKDLNAQALQYSPESATKQQPTKPITVCDRSKLVISIQNKDGLKQFRVYKDDKFERLYKMYAQRSKIDVKNLVFCYDGDKVSSAETPDSLGMEEDDMIEVHVKSS